MFNKNRSKLNGKNNQLILTCFEYKVHLIKIKLYSKYVASNVLTMKLNHTKIGIWGLGIVGKAAIKYLSNNQCHLSVMDNKTIDKEDSEFLAKHNASFFSEEQLEQFFNNNETILVSAGINHPACKTYKHKIINELDLFCTDFKKPIIAVTGTVGKTTVVSLLSQLLNKSMRVCTGGNIGIAMLDLIKEQEESDTALLELSSFQLAHATQFTPELAIWTNCYPNHIDWHKSYADYFLSKQNIMRQQKSGQKALLPLNIVEQLLDLHKKDVDWYAFSPEAPTCNQKEKLKTIVSSFFYIKDDAIVFEDKIGIKKLIKLKDVPNITFTENWIIIAATLKILNLPVSTTIQSLPTFDLPEHRLELIAKINGISFYNDSKSTTVASTQAAIKKLNSDPIILILGGISKGIDREPLIKNIDDSVKYIVCFGKERKQLRQYAEKYKKACCSVETLDEAFQQCIKIAQHKEQVLFSPSGASFDQFNDYKERGTYFKKLAHTFKVRI